MAECSREYAEHYPDAYGEPLNLLPVPALDGGRLVFLLWEAITHRPVPPEKEGIVHFIGLMFFMVLMVFLLFNDLVNIFG